MKRWIVCLVVLSLLACGSAFADSVNFTFSGTDQYGAALTFNYDADPIFVNGGGFAVFQFLNGASCTVSTGDSCGSIGFVNNLNGYQISFAYDGKTNDLFFFPDAARLTDGTYSTLNGSPGTGTLIRTFDANGAPDGGNDEKTPVPEPAALALLLCGLSLTGLALRRASFSVSH